MRHVFDFEGTGKAMQLVAPLTEEHLQNVCQFQKPGCCRYLVYGPDGLSCAKHNYGLKDLLDARVKEGTMRAKGDNCEGIDHVQHAIDILLKEPQDDDNTGEPADPG